MREVVKKEWPFWVMWTREVSGLRRCLRIATFPYFIVVCIWVGFFPVD
jgi:hypothetical protein